MTRFLERPIVKLQDVWPPYKAALDKFERESTAENWEAVVAAAQQFFAKVKQLPERVDA